MARLGSLDTHKPLRAELSRLVSLKLIFQPASLVHRPSRHWESIGPVEVVRLVHGCTFGCRLAGAVYSIPARMAIIFRNKKNRARLCRPFPSVQTLRCGPDQPTATQTAHRLPFPLSPLPPPSSICRSTGGVASHSPTEASRGPFQNLSSTSPWSGLLPVRFLLHRI
jgi:hypothetical protein